MLGGGGAGGAEDVEEDLFEGGAFGASWLSGKVRMLGLDAGAELFEGALGDQANPSG